MFLHSLGLLGRSKKTYTEALLHMDGSNGGTTFTDSGPQGLTITVDNAVTVTGVKKFGTASCDLRHSAAFDGNLRLPAMTDLAGDFTIEMFFRSPSAGGTQNCLFVSHGTSWTTSTLAIYTATGGSAGKLVVARQGGALFTCSTTLSNDTWYHVALVRSGSTLTLYLDGVADGSITNSTTWTMGAPRIGQSDSAVGPNQTNCYIDEFRFSRAAIYTGTFTPPAAEFSS